MKDGDVVSKDQVLAEIDSDKATLELSAEAEGKVQLLAKEDQTVNVGDVVVKVDTSFKAERKAASGEVSSGKSAAPAPVAKAEAAKPVPATPAAHATPVAKAMLEEKGLSPEKVKGSGPNGRVTKSLSLIHI